MFGEAGVNRKLLGGTRLEEGSVSLPVICVAVMYHLPIYHRRVRLPCFTTRVTQAPDLPEVVYSSCPGQHLSRLLMSDSVGL